MGFAWVILDATEAITRNHKGSPGDYCEANNNSENTGATII